jgi:membrane protein implicated in regulation of membrane protease activity
VFVFGYALTMRPLLPNMGVRRAASLAFASDTVSITTMEIMDNLFILAVPGALAAGLADGLFWWSLIVSLVVAFLVTVPVNRWLIQRGKGHAVVHARHEH